MRDPEKINNNFTTEAEQVSRDMTRIFEDEFLPLTELMEDAFARLARSIERELERAARKGRLDFQTMVEAILLDMARLGTDRLIRNPLENILTGAVDSVFGGAPTGTPPFVPNAGKASSPIGKAAPVQISVNFGQSPPPQNIAQSEGQITAALTRALSRANRFS